MNTKKSVFGNNNPLARPAARYLNVDQPNQEDPETQDNIAADDHQKHLKQNTITKDQNHNHIENDHKDEKHISYVKEKNHEEAPKERNPESIQTNEERQSDDDSDPKEKPMLKTQKHLKHKKGKTEVMEDGPAKLKESFFISSSTMDRARNAVFSMPGATLSGTVEEALEMWLRSKERTHGGPFPERTCRIKTGRPMSR